MNKDGITMPVSYTVRYKINKQKKLTILDKKIVSVIVVTMLFLLCGQLNARNFNKRGENPKDSSAVRKAMDSIRIDSMCESSQVSYQSDSIDYTGHFNEGLLRTKVQDNMPTAYIMVDDYLQGVEDAANKYNLKKLHRTGIFVASILFSPLLTVIPVAIASKIPPAHLKVNASQKNNAAYMKGYKYEAKYIKKRQLWGSLVGGGTPWCIAAGLLLL